MDRLHLSFACYKTDNTSLAVHGAQYITFRASVAFAPLLVFCHEHAQRPTPESAQVFK